MQHQQQSAAKVKLQSGEEWQEHVDTKYNRVYYSNGKRSTWSRPELATALGNAKEGEESWVEAYDPTVERSYYYNGQSKRSTWTNPKLRQWKAQLAELESQQQSTGVSEEQVSPATSEKSVHFAGSNRTKQSCQSSWEEYVDPTYNQIYWYNPVTKESTWEKPDEVKLLEALPLRNSNSTTNTRYQHESSISTPTSVGTARSVPMESFTKGTVVEVHNLELHRSLNGMQGVVIESVPNKPRTIVRIGGKQLSLRNMNLREVGKSTTPAKIAGSASLVPSPINTSAAVSQKRMNSIRINSSTANSNPSPVNGTHSSTIKFISPRSATPGHSFTNSSQNGVETTPRASVHSPYKAFMKLVHWGVPLPAVEEQLRNEGLDSFVLRELLSLEQEVQPREQSSPLRTGERTGEHSRSSSPTMSVSKYTTSPTRSISSYTDHETPPPRPPRLASPTSSPTKEGEPEEELQAFQRPQKVDFRKQSLKLSIPDDEPVPNVATESIPDDEPVPNVQTESKEIYRGKAPSPPRRSLTSGNLEVEQVAERPRLNFQSSLSAELGKVKLRKTVSAGSGLGGNHAKRPPSATSPTWLESLRNNPRFTQIRQASISRGDLEED